MNKDDRSDNELVFGIPYIFRKNLTLEVRRRKIDIFEDIRRIPTFPDLYILHFQTTIRSFSKFIKNRSIRDKFEAYVRIKVTFSF